MIKGYFFDLIIELSKNEKLKKYRIINSSHTNYLYKRLVLLNFVMFTVVIIIFFCKIPNYVQAEKSVLSYPMGWSSWIELYGRNLSFCQAVPLEELIHLPDQPASYN